MISVAAVAVSSDVKHGIPRNKAFRDRAMYSSMVSSISAPVYTIKLIFPDSRSLNADSSDTLLSTCSVLMPRLSIASAVSGVA